MDTQHWQSQPILARDDGSYVIAVNGYPHHVPDDGEFAGLYAEVRAFVAAHPETLQAEPRPPRPSAEDLIAKRIAAVRSRLAAIDAESIRPLRAIADDLATEADRAKLAALEAEAGALREELAVLE